MTPAQKELIERARKNGGLLPTHGYNINTLRILRTDGLVRNGALREDTATAQTEIDVLTEQAANLLDCGDWKGARERLNEAWAIHCYMTPTRYRLTKLGETCDLGPAKSGAAGGVRTA